MLKNHKIRVEKEQSGWELTEFLSSAFSPVSKKQCKRWVDMGIVSINGKVSTKASHTLSPRDTIMVYFSMQRERQKIESSFAVIAEYPEFIFCNKPIGLISSTETVSDALGQNIEIVHRLDRETSGILVVAKTPAMQKALSSLFRSRKIQKEYVAIVPSGWQKESGTLIGRFSCVSKPSAKVVWTGKSTKGSVGVTHFRVVKRTESFVLLSLQPYTGRTHQLRVHCSEADFPIVGDYHYGSTVILPRLYLHAYALRFTDPITGKELQHLSPIPREFKELLTRSILSAGPCRFNR